MVRHQNTKPKITKPKITKVKKFLKKILVFLDTQLHEPKISKKIISEFFGHGVFVFVQEKFNMFRGARYIEDRG